MNLVSALVSGIRGAENGTATLYVRGTTQRATWYEDFEATTQRSADIQLDSNGGAEAYVGQAVDVTVRDSSGITVRTFTQGNNAGAVEVISPSFSGYDYETGAAGANEPVTLSAVLDLWKTQNGATDWKVLFGGVATTLQTALARVVMAWFDVTSPDYGALGDGANDDTSAIQAAINAATAAGGGIVFFPPGIYRITAGLTTTTQNTFLGSGIGASYIRMTHATANTFSIVSASTAEQVCFSGLYIDRTSVGSGHHVSTSVDNTRILIDSCILASTAGSSGRLVSVTSTSGSELRIVNSRLRFVIAGSVLSSSNVAWLIGCTIESVDGGAYNTTAVSLAAGGCVMGNRFDMSGVTSGAYISLSLSATSDQMMSALVGNSFESTSGTHLVTLSRVSEYGNRRASNVSFSITGDSASAAFGNSVFHSSERTYRNVALSASASYTIPDDTGTVTIQYTNASNTVTLTTPKFVPNKRWTLVLWNDRAGAISSLSFGLGSGVSAVSFGAGSNGGTVPLFSGNTYTVWEFVGIYVNSKSIWYGKLASYDVVE